MSALTVQEIEERLSPKIVESGEHWLWQGAISGSVSKGHGNYGYTFKDGKTIRVNRAIYEAFNGPIPEGLEVDHTCNNRLCVRIDHLEAVTSDENQRRKSVHIRVQHIIDKGHDFVFKNKGCAVCKREYNKLYKRRIRALKKDKDVL